MEADSPQPLAHADSPHQGGLQAWKKPHNYKAYYGIVNAAKPRDLNIPDTAEQVQIPTSQEHGYAEPGYRPPSWVSPADLPGATGALEKEEGALTHPGPTLKAVRSGQCAPVCEPHLQVLCGPMLRYDTVMNGQWRGAVLIVTNDQESIYHPVPTLTVEWEPEKLPQPRTKTSAGGGGAAEGNGERPLQGSADGEPKAGNRIVENRPTHSDEGVIPGAHRSNSSQIGTSKGPSSNAPASPTTFSEDEAEYSDSEPEEPASPTSPTSPTSTTGTHRRRPSDWAKSITMKIKNLRPSNLLKVDSFRNQPPTRPNSPPSAEEPAEGGSNKRTIRGELIYNYTGLANSSSFWRFIISIPLSACATPDTGVAVSYRVNNGEPITFHVAGPNQDFRWCAYSCNGFSLGVNPDDFKGEGFESGFDPVWADLLERHEERQFHCIMGGGDQIYCDALMSEPEMADYKKLKNAKEKINYAASDAIKLAVDRFYFNHYCLTFRNGCFGRAISSIPMINMLDDHDLLDGYGSYPDDLMRSPMFSLIGARGYFWFLLFQQFTVDTVDGTLVEPGKHTFKSTIIGADGPYIPNPSHSSIHWFGPHVRAVLLDARCERKKDLIITPETYELILNIVRDQPDEVEHLIMQLGIPIAYPRMNFAEKLMSSDSTLTKVAKQGFMMPGANKYNRDMELLDDLSDHWTATNHKRERNWFIQQLQSLALERKMRISFVSGDVHLAAVGLFKTWTGKGLKGKAKRETIDPSVDHRWMLNIVSSGIVNTPPPQAARTAVNLLASKKHRTLHYADTDEVMVPIFKENLQGKKSQIKYVMGARNYTIAERDVDSGEYVFDIRCERKVGLGETKGYTIRAPPPRWA